MPEPARESPRTSWAANLALLLGSVLLALGVLELGVRCARGRVLDRTLLSSRFESGKTEEQPYAEYHPRLGWVPNPGTRWNGEARYTVLDDNLRSNGGPRPAGRPILAVGDSFTFGDEVADADTWPARLEARLGRPVINAGVSNYGFDQSVLRAEELVPRHEPALVIVGLIEDDIERCEYSVRFQAKPYFVLGTDGLRLENVPVPLPGGYDERELDLFRRSFGYSHLVDFAMRRLAPGYWLNARTAFKDDLGRERWAGEDEGQRIACALMRRLRHLKEDHDTDVVLVALYTNSVKEKHALRVQRVFACAARHGLATLDLFEPLRALGAADPARLRSLFRIHMTPEGNDFVAAEIARFLETRQASAAR